MALVRASDLLKQLQGGDIRSLYYLWGSDVASVESLTHRMVKRLTGGDSHAVTRFDGAAFDADAFTDAAMLFPMCADYNVLLINDFDCEQQRDSVIKQVSGVLSELPPTTVVIVYQTGVDVCGGKRKPTSKNAKFQQLFQTNGMLCEMAVRTPAQLGKTIAEKAARSGCTISKKNAEFLAERCLCNLLVLRSELDKLCAYAQGQEITESMITELVSGQIETDSYALARAVISKNAKETMRLFGALIPFESPDAILAALSASMMDLYRAASAMAAGLQMESVRSDFPYQRREFAVKNAFRDCRKLSMEQLRACIQILETTSAGLHSMRTDPQLQIEQALISMLRAAR